VGYSYGKVRPFEKHLRDAASRLCEGHARVVVTGCTVLWIGSAIDKEHTQVTRPQSAKTSTSRGLAQRKKIANAEKGKKGEK
jgi:hypothetical protein